VVEDTPPSSSTPGIELVKEQLLRAGPISGCVELTGETCCALLLLLPPSPSGGKRVFGLEVVLLASPFSTLFVVAAPAAAAGAADVEVVGFIAAIVLTVEGRLLEVLCALERADAEAVDFMVGVTVADGLVDAGLSLASTNGLMGVVVVEAPATLGNGVSDD
jgi:hypothetical protein